MEANMIPTFQVAVEAEAPVYSSRYSNNGSSPMWCFGNTCVVRVDDNVFVSGYERVPAYKPMNDCRWVLFKLVADHWHRAQADETGGTREPSPLGCFPDRFQILLSANPTLLPRNAAGGGRARPQLLVFGSADPQVAPRAILPKWRGNPSFNQHSYRSMAIDAARAEVILFQNVGHKHAEWALLDSDSLWHAGKLDWPPHAKTDLAPFGAGHARVNYPVVVLRDRAVHFCGVSAYDNWDRVRRIEDLGLIEDPDGPGKSGMGGRQRGNRFRRLLYAWTREVGNDPFSDWLEIDNTFSDGGWLFATDMYVDAERIVHLLWFRSPMLPAVRDAFYPDIRRVYSIEYARLRDGNVLSRKTLLQAGEGHDNAVPTDLDQVGRPYLLDTGKRILSDPISTPRFHITPNGRLFVVYYVSDGENLSENRILEIRPDGDTLPPMTIPLKHPLVQFFTATPRAGCKPSWTIDLLGHRRGGWQPVEDSHGREWDGTVCYAQVRLSDESTGGKTP